ncbi:MAG: ComEC/Rec2 family competence protein [Spirochaetales bacterium]
MKNKDHNIKLKFSKMRIVIFIILLTALIGSLFYTEQIETLINVGYSNNGAVLDENGLVVHFVNVGQGDGIVIELPDDKTMIIDGGPTSSADDLIDYIDNNVFDSGTSTFDYMVLTHSDADHIGAIDEILGAYQVNNIYRPKIYATYENIADGYETIETAPNGTKSTDTLTYYKAIDAVLNEPNCDIYFTDEICGTSINGGSGANSYSITFLSPSQSYYSDTNEYSPIMVLEYNGKTMMFTGDAPISSEEEVLNNYTLGHIDLLKLGHHGSDTSTGTELLSAITPTYAIISVGANNSYGHPSEETINRLLYSGVLREDIFRTDENGNIVANVNILGDINIFVQVDSLPTYIEWEYVAGTLIVIAFWLCFSDSKKFNF